MARIVGIDYGHKRVGIAVTDSQKIIATALTTLETKEVFTFLLNYIKAEEVESFVVGLPKSLQNTITESTQMIQKFAEELKNKFPLQKIYLLDERFTSKMATDSLLRSGTKKKDRQKKENLDKISATIILQDFLNTLTPNQLL